MFGFEAESCGATVESHVTQLMSVLAASPGSANCPEVYKAFACVADYLKRIHDLEPFDTTEIVNSMIDKVGTAVAMFDAAQKRAAEGRASDGPIVMAPGSNRTDN